MTLPVSFYIALRYWRTKSNDRFARLVGNLASFGIVLGVMALIIVLSVMNGLENNQKKQILSALPHAIIKNADNIPFNFVNSRDDNVTKLPFSTPHFVNQIVPINHTQAIFQSNNNMSAGQVIGVASPTDDPEIKYLTTEQFNEILPVGKFNIVIGQGLAQRLNVQIGDKVRLLLSDNSQYTPLGRIPVQRLFTVSDIYFSDNFEAQETVIFANLMDIGRLMRIRPEQVQGYRLFLDDPFKITELPQYFDQQWKIEDWRIQKGEFFQAVRMEKNMMSLLISLIIVVAISNIVTSLSLMVVDKQGEIAILQTQGLKKSQVRQIFIFQGILVGTLGTLVGTILGVFITLYLGEIVQWVSGSYYFYLQPEFNFIQILWISLFSLGLSLLSTLYPAYRAAQIQPATALRYE